MTGDEGIDFAELARQHAMGNVDFQIIETRKAGVKAIRVNSHPLDRFYQNGSIDRRQYDSGLQLYKDYTFAQIRSSYSSFDGSAAPTSFTARDVTERQMAARDAYTQALLAVGPRLSASLSDIVLREYTLEQHAGRLRQSPRTAKRALLLALDSLGDFYRMGRR